MRKFKLSTLNTLCTLCLALSWGFKFSKVRFCFCGGRKLGRIEDFGLLTFKIVYSKKSEFIDTPDSLYDRHYNERQIFICWLLRCRHKIIMLWQKASTLMPMEFIFQLLLKTLLYFQF